MAGAQKTVRTPTELYSWLNERWSIVRALRGGTLAMRAAGSQFLPQEKKEEAADYQRRLARSFLFAAYTDSVDKVTAKPFAREVQLRNAKGLHEQLAMIEHDTDRNGTTLSASAHTCMTLAIDHGMVHAFVDYPRVDGQPSVADERAARIHPTILPISPSDVIGWQSEQDPTGAERLTQVRIVETVHEANGEYDSAEVEQVRVLTPQGWELHRQIKDMWQQVDAGEWVGLSGGEIPFVTAYLTPIGFMQATPAMEDLAHLNIAHWQSSSDQRNILRFARAGLLFVKGMTLDEIEEQGGLSIGPSSSLIAHNEAADARVVEHSGSAIDAGARDLESLEQKMQVLGLQPFHRLTGGSTATEKMIDERRTETEVQSWIKAMERLLIDCYGMAARWLNTTLPDHFQADIYSDFVVPSMLAVDLDTLLKMRMSGNLDLQTFLTEIKRRGIFGEGTTEEEIMARLETEGPGLAGIGAGAEL